MSEIKSAEISKLRIFYIVFSFLLGFLDMTFLSQVFENMGFTSGGSRLIALALATAANFMALTWGAGNGKRMEKKAINSRSAGEFIAWLALGVVYVVLRVINIFKIINNPETQLDPVSEMTMMIILAISYVTTGFLIQSSARELSWSDAVELRRTKKKFEESREALAADAADLNESIGILSRYKTHFNSLDIQRKKIENSIQKTEKATMSDLMSKVLTKNKNISPIAAREVMNKVVSSYRNEK